MCVLSCARRAGISIFEPGGRQKDKEELLLGYARISPAALNRASASAAVQYPAERLYGDLAAGVQVGGLRTRIAGVRWRTRTTTEDVWKACEAGDKDVYALAMTVNGAATMVELKRAGVFYMPGPRDGWQ